MSFEPQPVVHRQTAISDYCSPAAKYREEIGYLVIVAALIVSLVVVTWIVGHTHRVIYLGPDNGALQTADEVRLRTTLRPTLQDRTQ